MVNAAFSRTRIRSSTLRAFYIRHHLRFCFSGVLRALDIHKLMTTIKRDVVCAWICLKKYCGNEKIMNVCDWQPQEDEKFAFYFRDMKKFYWNTTLCQFRSSKYESIFHEKCFIIMNSSMRDAARHIISHRFMYFPRFRDRIIRFTEDQGTLSRWDISPGREARKRVVALMKEIMDSNADEI